MHGETDQKLRICHVIEATAGGSARIAAQLVQDQAARGADVTLIYSPARADAWFLEAIEQAPDVKKIQLPMKREVGFYDLISFFRLLVLLYKEEPFDVLHSHSSKAGALARLLRFFIPRPVQVYSPHAFYSMSPGKSRMYVLIERMLSYLADAIILVSPLEWRHATEVVGIRPDKLHIILNGVALDHKGNREAARRTLGGKTSKEENGAFILGFVARLEEAKNPARLVDSFALIAAQRADVRLIVIGEGSLRPLMEERLASAGLAARAQFLPVKDARDLIPGFDCLICTSDYESFCLVIVEALAANVPVVTTPVGISEVAIIDGQNGYVAANEPHALAEAVLKLAQASFESRSRMMDQARVHLKQFDVKHMLEQTCALYRQILLTRGGYAGKLAA